MTAKLTAALSKTEAPEVHDFLSGGGEMAKLVRSMDWSATALGPIETWPQSLRTTVSLCLASNFPINIAWGPGHAQIYNDGYWPIVGGKHPESMGQDYSICWASAWPAIGEAFDRGWAGEASYIENQRMFLDRNGFLEETFFTFSFSPIRDESGAVGGLFHPVTEQTDRILSERRIQLFRDLATHAGSARTTGEVYTRAMEVFAAHAFDLPFVLIYQLNEQATRAELVAQTGLPPGTAASAKNYDLTKPATAWPFADALGAKSGVQVDAADQWLAGLDCGPYEEVPKTAFLLPIFVPGSESAEAVVIAGGSSRLPLNEAYHNFYGLLVASLSACVSNARNYENESKRAEALAELDRAKTIFFSNISHELRTPLSLILGPLDEVLSSGTDLLAPAQSQCLEIVRRNSQRLLKLVNTILDFSRLETGQTNAQAQATNLAIVTAEHASSFRSLCERAGLRLTVDCDPALDAVYVDHDMWEKIILNLLSNAFKFTFTGEIHVGLRGVDGQRIELVVRDTGIGIPPETLPHVFERFTRVENAAGRSHEGSGIGLALVQELVKLLGGAASVESRLGAGSAFRVVIPWRRAAVAEARPKDHPMTARSRGFIEEASHWLPEVVDSVAEFESADAPASGLVAAVPNIVLADDNADMRGFISRILTSNGFKVSPAADGKAALAAIRGRTMPDLVITDVMMPKLDGFGLLREIRGDSKLRHLPVLMLSARAGEEAKVEGLSAGADDYLVKPFGARELVARVNGNIDMARLRKRLAVQDRFALMVDASPVALLLVAPSGLIEMANRQVERLSACAHDALINMPLESLIPEHAAGRHAILQDCFGLDAVSKMMIEGLESCWRRQDGVEVPVEISVNAIDLDGRRMLLVAISDISVRHKMQLDREIQRRELERSNRDLEAFTYIASHDLKAPLRGITHLAEWIADDIEATASPKTLDHLKTLVGRTIRLQGLLDGLLDYSRAGRDPAQFEDLNVAALVADIVALTPPPPGFTVTCAPPMPTIRSSPTPLRVVLDNLIGNAFKHHDKRIGKVTVSMQLHQGIAEFRVSDDGPGISRQFHDRVFGIFRTLASRDVLESSGVGLAIVKKMIEVHGGQIRIESAPPVRGTSFVFTWRETPK